MYVADYTDRWVVADDYGDVAEVVKKTRTLVYLRPVSVAERDAVCKALLEVVPDQKKE